MSTHRFDPRTDRLREFYTGPFTRHFRGDASPRTLQADREALWYYERYTPDAPVASISADHLCQMRDAMAALIRGEQPQSVSKRDRQRTLFDDLPDTPDGAPAGKRRRPLRSKRTANKHRAFIQQLLRKCGPPGERNLDALHLIDTVPYCKPLKAQRKKPRLVRDDLVERLYNAAEHATKPELPDVSPMHWVQAAIVCAIYLGYRRGGLLSLTWDDVDWTARRVHLSADADKCDTERSKPANDVVIAHLMRIRGPRELVFAWPHSQTAFNRQWHRLQRRAGIPEREHIKFHDLKRYAGKLYSQVASPWAVMEMLDHTTLNTSLSYINPDEETRDASDKVRILPAFRNAM